MVGYNEEFKCSECGNELELKKEVDAQGFEYGYYSCLSCGYGFLDKEQFLKAVDDYKKMKKYNVKVSKWGTSLGMRIPKDLAEEKGIDENSELVIIPEKDGMKVMKSL